MRYTVYHIDHRGVELIILDNLPFYACSYYIGKPQFRIQEKG